MVINPTEFQEAAYQIIGKTIPKHIDWFEIKAVVQIDFDTSSCVFTRLMAEDHGNFVHLEKAFDFWLHQCEDFDSPFEDAKEIYTSHLGDTLVSLIRDIVAYRTSRKE